MKRWLWWLWLWGVSVYILVWEIARVDWSELRWWGDDPHGVIVLGIITILVALAHMFPGDR